MKKRLRKKLHMKEFTSYGLNFKLLYTPTEEELEEMKKGNVPYTESIILFDKFIDFVDGCNMFCGGGASIDKKTNLWNINLIIELVEEWRNRYIEVKAMVEKWISENCKDPQLTFGIIDLWNERKITDVEWERITQTTR